MTLLLKRFLYAIGMLCLIAAAVWYWSDSGAKGILDGAQIVSESTKPPIYPGAKQTGPANQMSQAKQMSQYNKMPRAKQMPLADKLNSVEMKKGRGEYFFNLLKDPATNRIPENIRARELEYAKTLPSRGDGQFMYRKQRSGQPAASIEWNQLGPKELGGRTRALAIDQRSSDVVIAGGVSGGIWKSTDGGFSWSLKTDPNQNMSVVSLAQDPTAPDTWYYSSGEFSGNSASDRDFQARYYGTGVYKSTDNGESWTQLTATADTDQSFNSSFDYVPRVKVSPTTGSVFLATAAGGLKRSTDGGSSFTGVLGSFPGNVWMDIDIDANGNLVAVASEEDFDPGAAATPGVYYSTDEGSSWIDITPGAFPTAHDRSVITFAPSDPTIAYVVTEKTSSNTNQGVSFFQIDITDPNNPVSDDRSANLPNFGSPVGGVNLQGGYNMVVAVKPDNPDFVLLGGTNLFRSTDGFSTTPSGGYDNSDSAQKDKFWIGGYDRNNDISQYRNQHPDQHVIAFDPNDPGIMWSGHDGGLSITSDITAEPVSWQNTNNGFITGQFYTVALPPAAGDNRIAGGTQDNGTPFFEFDTQNQQSTNYFDISSGDGSYTHISPNTVYSSSQRGVVLRWNASFSDWNYVHPSSASNQLFIHPYAVDPNDENTMYYPGGTTIWRNTTLDQVSNASSGGTTDGWGSFSGLSETGYTISTLEVSTAPSNILYYGASSNSNTPKIIRLDNASSATSPTEISISTASSGAYVHDIAINPEDADEVLVILSNYNIESIFHTTDGGSNWTSVEGNLDGTSQNPGPSVRSATILPTDSGVLYLAGTSTGVFSTSSFSGSSTSWVRESDGGTPGTIGYSVVESIASRPADGKIAAASHGRGIFMGEAGSTLDPNDTTPPADPTDLQTASSSGDIQLNWTANSESDLAKYLIYRGRDSSTLSLYDSTSSTTNSYGDTSTNFENYYYTVTAKDVNGNESGFSNSGAVVRDYLSIDTDWKLLGTPLTSSLGATLPSGTELVTFDGGYAVSSGMAPAKGYWAKGASKDSIKLDGGGYTSLTVTLNAGWNLVPGIADTLTPSDIQDPNGVRSTTPVYEYDGSSYVQAGSLLPGGGYWVHADKQGDVTLEAAASKARRAPLAANLEGVTDKLVFSRQGVKQQIVISSRELERDQKMRYLRPPLAPSPTLDVRTSDQFGVVDSPMQELEIVTDSYPVSVKLEEGGTESHYRLKGINSGEEVYFELQAGESTLINGEFEKLVLEQRANRGEPLTYELLPNYPNPFNPTTNIRYKLASKSMVQLSVYDVLGRRVRLLVNKVQQAGTYTMTFDASKLSSGTYFIRISAGDFNKVQQMTLIK